MPDRPMTDANAPQSGASLRVSVVVPVRNEAGNVAPLIGEIAPVTITEIASNSLFGALVHAPPRAAAQRSALVSTGV